MFDGTLIRELREAKGLTQSQLGNLIGADGNLISRWELKKVTPSNRYLEKLAEVLEKPLDFFINGDNSPVKERSVVENKGMLIFEFDNKRLEVPATSEFSQQFWERVDRILEFNEPSTQKQNDSLQNNPI